MNKEHPEPDPAGSRPDYAEALRGKRIVVFGASGFIGRWVARLLTGAGAELILPVRDPDVSSRVFREFGISGNVSVLDLMDTDRIRTFLEKTDPVCVFNLAGYGIDREETDEATAFIINRALPGIICSALTEKTDADWRDMRFVHAGTAMEYGAVTGDLDEKGKVDPTTLYGRSKLEGTRAVTEAAKSHGTKALTARLFAVYGPGEGPSRLLPSLMAAKRNDSAISFTEGLHKRDFTYVGDVAEGLLRLALTDAEPGEVVNLATGRLTSIRRFAETAAEIIGLGPEKLDFGALPTRPEEMRHFPVTIKALKRLTCWSPGTPIEDGIRKAVHFPDAFTT